MMMAAGLPMLLLLACASSLCSGGVPHSHQHDNKHREREADGAFSPRDRTHHDGDADNDAAFDHEAILGSAKEAEEFDELSPGEAKRRLGELLKKMDRNGDEKVDKDELRQWILRSFRSLAVEESAERFEESDTDEGGAVTWDEYKKEEFDLDAGEDGSDWAEDDERAEEYSMMQEDKLLFDAADKNSDGQLDKTEFLSFSHPEEDPQMHDIVLEQVLKQKDKDADGLVDFQEYVGQRGRDQSKEWVVAEKERFDNDLDKNSDGKLDRDEILSWMIPSNEEMAKDEVDHLFAGSDDDVDGSLTFKEVLDHHDLFVGSEATDYGEMLHKIDEL